MKRSVKRIFPVLLILLILGSIVWYLGVYDRGFTQDILLNQARFFDDRGNHNIAAWLYELAYKQSNYDESVAIELAEKFKQTGNYTKAEYTLSNAIADGGSVDLYIALCKTYVEQDKLLDAVTMLDNVSDVDIKHQLDLLRPQSPTTSPTPGYYSQYITVEVKCPTGTLYVTNDKSYPSTTHDPYNSPVQLVGGENTIYALAVGENGLVSKLSIFGYVVGGVIEEVTLSDSAVDTTIRQLLGKAPTDPLLSSELWTITSLTLPSEVTQLTDMQALPYLKSLTIENANLTSLNGISSLSALTELTIRKTILTASDVAMIGTLTNLQKLTLEDCSLSSIANLSGANKLVDLDLSGNIIRELSCLVTMTNLQRLDLSRNAVNDLTNLSVLTNLVELDVSYNSVPSLAPLVNCTALKVLDASHNAINALDGVEAMTALTNLSVAYNNVTDVNLLAENTELISLDISNNNILDISALSTLNNLESFDFSRNEIAALPAFSAESKLVNITGSYNNLTSLQPLSGLGQLNNVIMEYNAIGSVEPLTSCHMLTTVNVYGNPVKNVTMLTDHGVIVFYTPV
jgi:Leucine-rich repeat (LRR) protein